MEDNILFKKPSDLLDWSMRNIDLLGSNKKVFNDYYSNYIKPDGFNNNMKKYFDSQSLQICKDIISSISKSKKPKILEIGSGCGTEAIFFALLGAKVVGIDIRKGRLECATKRVKILEDKFNIKLDISFYYQSVIDYNKSNKFDIIWMEQAFHHIEPRNDLYKKINEILNNNGKVFLSEANPLHPSVSLSLFLKRGFKTIKNYEDSDGNIRLYGDERIITHFALQKAFKKIGFKTIELKYYRLLPNKKFLINNFYFLEKIIPSWFIVLFGHYNIGFLKE